MVGDISHVPSIAANGDRRLTLRLGSRLGRL